MVKCPIVIAAVNKQSSFLDFLNAPTIEAGFEDALQCRTLLLYVLYVQSASLLTCKLEARKKLSVSCSL